MVAEANHSRYPLLEHYGKTAAVVGAKRDAVIGGAETETNRRVPTVWPGDERVVDIRYWGLHTEAAKGGAKKSVRGEGYPISLGHPQRNKGGCPASVHLVGEEAVLVALFAHGRPIMH